jgi:curved DNA-binding protein CbpA
MNYYEELGIRQDAPLEEIRQAYKLLARLLHPDGQPEARLKAMGECQMRRLNEILAILTDPMKRRQYDESLCQNPTAAPDWEPPAMVEPAYWYRVVFFGLRHWFWILIGLVVVGVGLWCVQQSNSAVSQVTPIPGGPATDKPAGGEAPQQPTGKAVIRTAPHGASAAASREATHTGTRQPAVMEKAAAVAKPSEPARPSPAIEPPPPLPAPPVAAEFAKVVPAATKAEPAVPTAKAHEVSFAGNWLYAPETASRTDPNLYPATSVEFLLAEENGSLAGTYHAKYRVPDQAISPEVQFRVQGKSTNGKVCRVTWASEDGAQGEAELTLRSMNQLNVTWWTKVFGRRAALSSGMAVLTRQQAP